jgi:predicted dehydrogenase
MSSNHRTGETTRRDFLKTSAAAATLAVLAGNVHAEGSDVIKVGLIGCGGRGSGAADNVLHAAPGVKIVAIGDAFADRAQSCRQKILKDAEKDEVKKLGNSVDLPDSRVFVGLDAYQKVIACDVNYIMLATPPGFRPLHLAAAVAAGKNVFTEKPVATDAPGIRNVFDTYEKAKEKKLGIVAGTQRRHQLGYLETMKHVHGGDIGDIVAGRCYWNQGILWHVKRTAEMTDLVWQLRNWYNFTWICGDHIVEQHVHNIDVINWALGALPIRATGMGGRQRSVSNPDDYGNIFDHFTVEFEYPKGIHVMSQCRQIDGCANSVSEALVGTRGTCQVDKYRINDRLVLTREQDRQSTNPYVQEHTDLIESIRKGSPLNELKTVAESTMTAILGRMSTYTGKTLTWDQALGSKEELMPHNLAWDMTLPVPPVAVPGQTKFV